MEIYTKSESSVSSDQEEQSASYYWRRQNDQRHFFNLLLSNSINIPLSDNNFLQKVSVSSFKNKAYTTDDSNTFKEKVERKFNINLPEYRYTDSDGFYYFSNDSDVNFKGSNSSDNEKNKLVGAYRAKVQTVKIF